MSKEGAKLQQDIQKCIANAKESLNGHKGFVAGSLIQVAVSKKGILDPNDTDIKTIKQTFIDSDPAITNSDDARIRRGAKWVTKKRDGKEVQELEGAMEESKSIIQVQNETNKQINALIKRGAKEEDFRALKAELDSYTQEITDIFEDKEKLYNLVIEKTTRGLIDDSFPKFTETNQAKSLIPSTVLQISQNINLPQDVARRYILASKEEKDAIIAICRNVNNNIFGKEVKLKGKNSYYALDASKITPENKALAAQEIQSKLENYVLINLAIDNALEKKQKDEKKTNTIELTQDRRDKIFASLDPVLSQLDPLYLEEHREDLITDLAGRLNKKGVVGKKDKDGNTQLTVSAQSRKKIAKDFLKAHQDISNQYAEASINDDINKKAFATKVSNKPAVAPALEARAGRPLPPLPRPLPPLPRELATGATIQADAKGIRPRPLSPASTTGGVRGPSHATPPPSPASTTGGVRGPSDMNKTQKTVSPSEARRVTHIRVVGKSSPASTTEKERDNQLKTVKRLSEKVRDSINQTESPGKKGTVKCVRVTPIKSTNKTHGRG